MKTKVKTVMTKCECSRCGQVSNVPNVGAQHAFCTGFTAEVSRKYANAKLNLTGRKGTWEQHWLAGVALDVRLPSFLLKAA